MKVSIPVNLNDTEEPKPVPTGTYDLIIVSAEEKVSQAGKPMIAVSLGIEGHEEAPNASHFISLPTEEDETRSANFKALSLRRFLEAFGIPYDSEGFDIEDFPGAKARIELGLSEPDDSGNIYNRLKLPKLKGEGEGGRRSPPPPKR